MEKEFRRIVDALPGLVWTALPDGGVDFLNQRWCDYTGLGLDEGYGQGWQNAIHPEDLPGLFTRWRSILTSGEPGEMEARLRRLDGEYRWFLFRISPMAGASGQAGKWCGIISDIDDQRRAEEGLRVREGHYRSIADSIPALIAFMTPAGEVESVNRHVLDYFGATLEELKGWAAGDTVHADDLPAVIAAWMRAVETGEPYDIEHRIRRADGVYRWFHVRGLPLRDTGGHIARWYVLETDIDDRKRAEAMLAGEKRLLEMVASGRCLSDILSALCGFVEEAAADCHCGFYAIDWSGPSFRNAVAPSLPASYLEPIEGLPVHGDTAPCGIAAYLKTQVIVEDIETDSRWQASAYQAHVLAHGLRSVWSTPIHSKEGLVLGTFCVYQRKAGSPSPRHQELIAQVTHIASIAIERSQAEAALKRSEALLAEGQRLSLTGTFSWRVATDEIVWSDQSYRLFDVDPATPLTFELVNSRIHPEDMPAFNAQVEWARRTGDDFEFECRLLMPDLSVEFVHVVAHARDRSGQPEYIGAMQNVTQRRLSDEALGKARSELARVARVTSLGVLTASIAHEVNQPLSGIITNASTCLRMLAGDPPNVDGAIETARRTIRDGHRASNVIQRLRSLFSKKDVTAESVDLNEIAREVIALSLSELHRNRVIMRVELAEDVPSVMGDRVQLQQVMLNLLLNGSEAMNGINDRPREMLVRTEFHGGSSIRFSVRDAGVGFEPQGVDKLFEAFYTTKSSGMGIGLSVSRSIIEGHHGRLWATPNEGPGATFLFSIPRESERWAEASGVGAMRAPGRDGCQARQEEFVMVILPLVSVVDDDESVRESLPDLLREFGFAAQAFSSAEAFLASDCIDQTRCLILDVAMPGMSGPDLQRELTRRRQEVPIVFITAHGDATVRPRLLEQGAVACLFKPFSETALLDAINAALRVN